MTQVTSIDALTIHSPNQEPSRSFKTSKPRLGFLGVGWIGRHRLEAIHQSGHAEIAAVADLSLDLAREAARIAPGATVAASLEAMLDLGLDGVIIATPSALHADQAILALDNGVAVFCQKPLGRTAEETRRVVDAARRSNGLLGVDLSYRFINGMAEIHHLCASGELGSVYAADMVFHNAYGPDKPWFYDRHLAGGGCVVDLGIHLVDLALWNLRYPTVCDVASRLYTQGQRIRGTSQMVEDYCEARIDLECDVTVRLACSWKLHAGREAVISATFYGTHGGVSLSNVNGSFYDFIVERFHGTEREKIAGPPDAWGGRAAVHWARQLDEGFKFDPSVAHLGQVAAVLDAIYEAA